MEDVARFALDHPELCQRIKNTRHDLVQAVLGIGGGRLQLLANRDTPGDVGTQVKTISEGSRSGLGQVVEAAVGRVSEAMRVIEEVAKVAGSVTSPTLGVASTIERLRYDVYDIGKRLGLAMGAGRAAQWKLCVLLSDELCAKGGRSWRDVAQQALVGGADCLQLREKGLSDRELLSRAEWLARSCRERGAALIVNDRVDIALLARADGVHLGQGDLSVCDARRLAGDRLLIGVSTHDVDEARRAIQDGADYAGVGAMFATSTKERPTSGVAYLRQFLALVKDKRPIGHLAIGGITVKNVRDLVRAGCRGIAVSACVCAAADPAGVCRQLREAIDAGQPTAEA